jgi:predicted TIM-barrel fold metal-dependent hydrolase
MSKAGRFLVETHAHITTLYQPEWEVENWRGLANSKEDGACSYFDNSPLTLYDMEIYGVDMCLLKPSMIGTTNEAQADLVERYPDKFRAFCSDQKTKYKNATGEAEWTLEAAYNEVEDALKTGKFIGIGEFVPRDWSPSKVYTFAERLEEYRMFAGLARKYKVSMDFHEFSWGYEWDCWRIAERIANEFPDVPLILNHGGHSIGNYIEKDAAIRRALMVAGGSDKYPTNNVFLECGTWPSEFLEIAVKDPNVGITQLLWGSDYGHVPQYIVANQGGEPSAFSSMMKRWPIVPHYQTDWWGWGLHQIDKLRDLLTQDEINLILGGNAAKLWKLPVPYDRMFLCGRPDIWGIEWEKSIPAVLPEQVRFPDKK